MNADVVPSPKTRKKSGKKVEFEFFAPEAEKVQIAGSFNNWNPEAGSLKKNRQGKWKIAFSLAPGRYEYRFNVDGAWQNDQKAVECVPNAFGGWNCVLEVS